MYFSKQITELFYINSVAKNKLVYFQTMYKSFNCESTGFNSTSWRQVAPLAFPEVAVTAYFRHVDACGSHLVMLVLHEN